MKKQDIEALINLCTRRAIILPAFSIYGDIGGFYDYGPIGARIRNNIIALWRSTFIDGMGNLEVDTTIVAPSPVFEASGHLKNFADPIISCAKCGTSYRVDKLLEAIYEGRQDKAALSRIKGAPFQTLGELVLKEELKCEKCGEALSKSKIQNFNLMLGTKIGPSGDMVGYLRPETAQGIFMDFKAIFRAGGLKLPIAIGQAGRAFRNEISPRRMLIRMREFSQMELEYFVDPDEKEFTINNRKIDLEKALKTKINILPIGVTDREYIAMTLKDCLDKGYVPGAFFCYLLHVQKKFFMDLGFEEDSLRFRQVQPEERAHYSKGTIDVEARIDNGWEEISGDAYRTDFDLRSHEKHSKSDMSVVNGEKKLVPHVVELSVGLDRLFWTLLANSLYMDSERGWEVLKLGAAAPYDFTIFPLQRDEKLIEKALEIEEKLKGKGFSCQYSSTGSIGKRYARADEVGIPKAITVDFQTLEDGTVTIRDAITTKQERVEVGKIR
jgi:glycyl-tRNA synthetase